MTDASNPSPYADSIVPTEDGFRYSIQMGRDSSGETPYIQNGDEFDTNGQSSLSTWAICLIFATASIVAFGWCLYAGYAAYKTNVERQTAVGTQGQSSTVAPEAPKDLPRKVRRERLLEYFDRTGFQTVVKAEDVLLTTSNDQVDHDIEAAIESKDGHTISTPMEMDDSHDHQIFILRKPIARTNQEEDQLVESESDIEEGCTSSSNAEHITPEFESTFHESCTTPCVDEEKRCCCKNCSLEGSCCTNAAPTQHQELHVTDPCAICLEPYQAGHTVVWSGTPSCPHIFHKDCIMNYFLRFRGKGTPCPSCRQSFCDESIFCLTPSDQKHDHLSHLQQPVAANSEPTAVEETSSGEA